MTAKPRILFTVGNSQIAIFSICTRKDAQEEFFTAFIRVYIKYIASLYHKFNSQTVKLKRNLSTFHLQRILISRKIPKHYEIKRVGVASV